MHDLGLHDKLQEKITLLDIRLAALTEAEKMLSKHIEHLSNLVEVLGEQLERIDQNKIA